MAYTTNVAAEDNLQQIFDSLPENAVVRLAPGEYRQKTVIRTPGLTLTGAGMDKTGQDPQDVPRHFEVAAYCKNTAN